MQKNILSNNIVINLLDYNEPFNAIISIKRLHNCDNKHISDNMNNIKLLGSIISTKYLHSYAIQYISKGNKNNNSRKKITTTFVTTSTKYLAWCKTSHAIIKSCSSKKAKMLISVTTIHQLYKKFFLLFSSIKNLYYCKSKYISIYSDANS